MEFVVLPRIRGARLLLELLFRVGDGFALEGNRSREETYPAPAIGISPDVGVWVVVVVVVLLVVVRSSAVTGGESLDRSKSCVEGDS